MSPLWILSPLHWAQRALSKGKLHSFQSAKIWLLFLPSPGTFSCFAFGLWQRNPHQEGGTQTSSRSDQLSQHMLQQSLSSSVGWIMCFHYKYYSVSALWLLISIFAGNGGAMIVIQYVSLAPLPECFFPSYWVFLFSKESAAFKQKIVIFLSCLLVWLRQGSTWSQDILLLSELTL